MLTCYNNVLLFYAVKCRMSYGMFMLQEILQRVPENVSVHIMYDIACNFVRHLKSRDSQLLEKVAFAIPSFHAYGHKPACQVSSYSYIK